MAIRLLFVACVWTTFATSEKVVMEIPRKYKTGGALPNTCGTWQYGTTGRVGESMNPQCKSTEMDTGTTGIAQLTDIPAQARAFTQSVKITESNVANEPASYEMTTSYWNDAPCRSGEMFQRCTAILQDEATQTAGCLRQTQQADGTLVTDANGNLQQFTGTAPNAPNCMKYCCRSECPQQTCTTATDHDTCPSGSATDCPMWPQCLNTGGCSSVSPCSGVSGDIANGGSMCAAWYPGCGAVNSYSSMSYNGGAAENVMTARAFGTIVEVTESTSPALTEAEKMANLCGANNNLFSFSPSGSASLLQNAAVYVDRTQNAVGTCESGHPTYCECSRLAAIAQQGLELTISDSTLLSTFNSQCSSSCTGGTVVLGQTVTLGSSCSSSNCPFLSSIGYGPAVTNYYVQYYRPWEEENILYFGHQSLTMAGALEHNIHSEGVYELQKPCGACTLRTPTMLISVLVSLLGWLLA